MKELSFRAALLLMAFCTIADIHAYDFMVDGIYYNIINNNEVHVTCRNYDDEGDYSGAITIPECVTFNNISYIVTGIGERAFHNSYNLTNIDIPNSVSVIGRYAFYKCTSLSQIIFPNSIEVLDDFSFFGCSGLSEVFIPNSVKKLGESFDYGPFAFCSGLQSVHLPDSIEKITVGTFAECTGLKSINIPSTVTVIEESAFENCSSLTNIEIPSKVYKIGPNALAGTAWLSNQPDGMVYAGKVAYKYKGSIPDGSSITLENGTLGIAGAAFVTTTSSDYGYLPDDYYNGLTGISIPNTVRCIEKRAFYSCHNLREIIIPNSVTEIGERAFASCSSLVKATISDDVDTLMYGTFEYCKTLKDVTIGRGMKAFDNGVFYHCDALAKVTCKATQPPALEGQTFDKETYTNAVLCVPKESELDYMTAYGWKNFINIVGIDVHTGACDVNGDGVVNISDLNNVVNDILSGKGDPSMDVNVDGSVNISDINIIVQSILTTN